MKAVSGEIECPRCHQLVTGTARRRGRCTSCGATLPTGARTIETQVRAYLHAARAKVKTAAPS